MDVEEPIHKWYHLSNGQPNETAPAPKKAVTWADETKPPTNDSSEKEVDFELVMDIVYRDGTDKNITEFYEGDSANGPKHTIRL